jgi:putative transposase
VVRQVFKQMSGTCKKLRRVRVDGTYRGRLLECILHRRFRLQPVLRRDNQKGSLILPGRRVVERTFACITQVAVQVL